MCEAVRGAARGRYSTEAGRQAGRGGDGAIYRQAGRRARVRQGRQGGITRKGSEVDKGSASVHGDSFAA